MDRLNIFQHRKWILILFVHLYSIPCFAQTKIVVLPERSKFVAWCDYESFPYEYRSAFQGVEDALINKEYDPVSYLRSSQILEEAGLCKMPLDKVGYFLSRRFDAPYYMTVRPEVLVNRTTSLVSIAVRLYDSEDNSLIAAAEEASNQMPTNKYDQLAEMAFNRCYKKLERNLPKVNINQSNTQISSPSVSLPASQTVVPQPTSYQNTNMVVDEENYAGALRHALPITKYKKQNAFAVIIGNQAYQHTDIPQADYAKNDALLMKEYLVKSLGYPEGNIIFLKNASLSELNSMLGTKEYSAGMLSARLKGHDEAELFFYFSGHGVSDPETKEAFLVTSDANPTLISLTAYPVNSLYANLGKLSYSSLTIVVESCFSGLTSSGSLFKKASPVTIKPKIQLLSDERTIVMTASASDEIASWYPEKQHSLFTYFLIEGLSSKANSDKKKNEINLQEVQQYTSTMVAQKAANLYNRQQSPSFHGSFEKVLIKY